MTEKALEALSAFAEHSPKELNQILGSSAEYFSIRLMPASDCISQVIQQSSIAL
jgi:hypothetical protein